MLVEALFKYAAKIDWADASYAPLIHGFRLTINLLAERPTENLETS